MELSTSTISNEIDKSIQEEFSVSQAAIDEIRKRREKGQEPESLSNEKIRKGDPILDTYKVLDDAIHGGMGSVWRVHHDSWNVDLAMKRPQPRFFAEAGDGRKEEFIRECENWINLGLHPNIVSCYYVREIGGVPTIFSEWMDNGSLKDRIRDGSLYEGTEEEVQERILDIAIQTARGLKYSHENNLIHQDVKPGNILLTKDWDAKVADFGLAKAQSQLTENEKPVSTGYTIQYCPREQAEGAPAEKWMDVYAWALTVLEMYAGKRLWETGDEVKERFADYATQCEFIIPDILQALLRSCLSNSTNDFLPIENTLKEEYKDLFGCDYIRSAPDAAADTADSLNNRALSYYDLNKPEEAEKLWAEALEKDSLHLPSFYNSNLFSWRSGKTSGEIAKQNLENLRGLSCNEDYQKQISDLEEQLDFERNAEIMEKERERSVEYVTDSLIGVFSDWNILHCNKPLRDPRLHPFSYVGDDQDFQYIFQHTMIKRCTSISINHDADIAVVAGKEGLVEVYSYEDSFYEPASAKHDGRAWKLAWSKMQPTEDEKSSADHMTDAYPYQVTALGISEDNTLLFSTALKIKSALWELKTGKRLGSFDSSFAACFNHEGTLLASGNGLKNELSLWEIPSLIQHRLYQDLPGYVTALRFSQDDSELFVATLGGAVLRIDAEGNRIETVICGPKNSSVGYQLLTGGYRHYEYNGFHTILPNHDIPGNTVVAFSPDWKFGVTVGGHLCDLKTGKCLYTFASVEKGQTLPGLMNKPVMSPDGSKVFVTVDGEKVREPYAQIIANEKVGFTFTVPKDWSSRAAWLLAKITDYREAFERRKTIEKLIQDGNNALSDDNTATALYVIEQLSLIPGVEENQDYDTLCTKAAGVFALTGVRGIRNYEISPDQKKAITDKNLPWYTSFKREDLHQYCVEFKRRGNEEAAFCPYGNENIYCHYTALSEEAGFASTSDISENGKAVIWDLNRKRKVRKCKGKRGEIVAQTFSDNGQLFAFAGGKPGHSQITIYDIGKIRSIDAIPYKYDWVYIISFSSDGKRLAFAERDQLTIVKIGEKSENRYRRVINADIFTKSGFESHKDVKAIAFSMDGKRIWTLDCGIKDNLKLWDIESGDRLLSVTLEDPPYRPKILVSANDTKLYLYDIEDSGIIPEIQAFTIRYEYGDRKEK